MHFRRISFWVDSGKEETPQFPTPWCQGLVPTTFQFLHRQNAVIDLRTVHISKWASVKGFITLVNTNTVSRLFIIDFSIKVVWFPNNELHFSSIMLLHLVAVVQLIAELYLYIFKYKTDPQNVLSFLVVTPSFVFAFM